MSNTSECLHTIEVTIRKEVWNMNFKLFYDYRTPRVLELIEQLLKRESTAVITLDYLMVIAEREEDKESLRSIIRIRRESDERLKWTYYQYTKELPEVDQMTFARPDTFKEGIQLELTFQSSRIVSLNELYKQINSNYEDVIIDIVENEVMIEESLRVLLDRE